MQSGAEFFFWGVLVLLAYIYFGYPLVAELRARLSSRPHLRAPIEPFVSIIVVAHNEAERIAARIENLLAQDYPVNRFEVVVASDGSTDATVDCARQHEDGRVTVRSFATRRGKPAVLNAVVPDVRGEIVLFTDARQRFDPGTLRALVENFADPTVGAVSGELVLTTGAGTAAAGQGASFYWRYEKFIRAAEARADSTVGATGAVYAIRHELFEPIPDDTLLDDVLIPLLIARKGFRVLFEPDAHAFDCASATARQEFARKARTIAGTFQVFARERWLLNPFENRLWFQAISHKALRLALPGLHAVLLLATLALASQWLYQWALAAQLMFYAAALGGYVQRHSGRRSFIVSVPCAICLLNWATVVGFVRFLRNRQPVTWERGTPSGISLRHTTVNGFGIVAVALSLAIDASCSGIATTQTTGPASFAPTPSVAPAASVIPVVSVTTSPAAPAAEALLPVTVSTSGTVGPLLEGAPPCFADRYPCKTYDFSLARQGAIEVTMTWEGPPRAMLVQLYWAGEGLAHEDIAPRDGPSRIWFRRPRMEAAHYRLRVVSLEPERTIPFSLTLTH